MGRKTIHYALINNVCCLEAESQRGALELHDILADSLKATGETGAKIALKICNSTRGD